LYLLPRASGQLLADSFSELPELRESLRWFVRSLKASADELQSWVSRDGDEEDKQILINIFLWKQRHGLFDPSWRIKYQFDNPANAYYIHRYMLKNGYNGILDRPDHFPEPAGRAGVRESYLREIDSLLDKASSLTLPEQFDEFGELALFVERIGPSSLNYPRCGEVKKFAGFVLENYSNDPRLVRFSEDAAFTHLSWLLSDLKYEPGYTWKTYRKLALARVKRSISCYPAFLTGLEMYGERMQEIFDKVEIQGGNTLFLRLAGFADGTMSSFHLPQ